jgi:hypothetical protein
MKDQHLKPLVIIEQEINRLHTISTTRGLSYDDTKQLETLIKIKQLINGEPTQITKSSDLTYSSISDKAILKALSNQADKPKVNKRASKSKPQ